MLGGKNLVAEMFQRLDLLFQRRFIGGSLFAAPKGALTCCCAYASLAYSRLSPRLSDKLERALRDRRVFCETTANDRLNGA